MEWKKIRQKTFLLLCMTVVLFFLLIRAREGEPGKKGERAEILEIPEGEYVEEPEEIWSLPGADATIRVLLLAEDGGLFHEKQELDKEYAGELEYYEEENGWVIVNELPLEEYLRWVVPSEMPSYYSMEALKAQAVCARTYAVWHMQEYAYPEYEAHVDDSVSFQVYHNLENQETTDQAVRETEGQIMLYEDTPVKAYYFATSCGSTTDEMIWEKGDRNLTPYITGHIIGDMGTDKDLTDEEDFYSFITTKHAGDLEIAEPWYRWNCYVPLEQITANVETWADARAARSADGILLQKGKQYVLPGNEEIGMVESAEITERSTGGVVQQMLLRGQNGTLKIQYEYNIRLLLGIPGGEIHKNDGSTGDGGNLLPSGYFVLEPAEADGELTGYRVYGGGLGHGAGMSQNGARIMAEQGSGYEEILQYFYNGIRLARLGET